MADRIYLIGLMSGTSLDGLDIAHCVFEKRTESYHFEILESKVYDYPPYWRDKLKEVMNYSALEFVETDKALAEWMGEKVLDFKNKHKIQTNWLSSHGHTVFHQTEKKLTTQIAQGAALSVAAQMNVISDFRTTDVALGGQGAPLVPIGDKLLFSEYNYCLNLGGIANISFDRDRQRIAFDICPVNLVLNALANQKGFEYDQGGQLASSGSCHQALLSKLNALDFYQKDAPKSLGKEWVISVVMPILTQFDISIEDKLHTFCVHIGQQIAHVLQNKEGHMLVSGGGAYNSFLIKILQQCCDKIKIVLPSKEIIEFKEALIFAFLGLLRLNEEANCLASVTGASRDSVGGAIYLYK